MYKTYFPETQGGLQEAIRQISLSTRLFDVSPRVFTLSPDPNPACVEHDGIEVIRAKQHVDIASCPIGLNSLRRFGKAAAEADVVHYHFPWPFADLLHLVSRTRTPTVVTYHSDIVRQAAATPIYGPIMRRFLRSMDAVVATSPNYARSSDVLRSLDASVIPLGILESTYPMAERECVDSVRREVGDSFLLFIGVLRYYKGLDTLLDAVEGTSIPLVIVGSGPLKRHIEMRIARSGASNILALGSVSDAKRSALLELARAVCLPSHLRSEAFGMSLLEGAMMSKPLISCELGTGTTYVNIDGQTGLVVPPSDPLALRDAIQRLWQSDSLARTLGEGARARFESEFSGDIMGKRYAELYEGLTGPLRNR